jgi:hypothetical protein
MSGHIDDTRLVALGLGEAPSPLEAEHLAGCPTCAGGLAGDQQLWAQLRELPQPAPPPRFQAQALARFRRARAVRHRPWEIAVGGALVAVLVAVLVLWALRLMPGALVTVALSLPRWSSLVSASNSLGPVLAAMVPVLVLAATLALGGVGVMLRRLTMATAK